LPLRLFTIALAAFASGACSSGRAPLAPEPQVHAEPDAVIPARTPPSRPSSEPVFYPLETGNAWHYEGMYAYAYLFDDGRYFHEERPYVQDNVLSCEEEAPGGTGYVVEQQTLDYGGLGLRQWVRYRQSGAGLFELDSPVNTPGCGVELEPSTSAWSPPEPALTGAGALRAACLRARETLRERQQGARRAAGLDPASGSELTRLAYPLFVGAQWRIRDEPLYMAHVVGFEQVHLPAGTLVGFKVQITSELFGPRDRVYFWVSRNGFLAFTSDLQAPILLENGVPIGEATFHEERMLTAFEVARHLPWVLSRDAASSAVKDEEPDPVVTD